jgi:hypothetical protein
VWRNRIAATHTFRAVALQWFDDGLFHLADHAIHFKKHRLFCYRRSVHPANIRSDLGTNSRSARFGHRRSEGCKKMLTTLATLTAPIVVLTILIIVVCEIKDAWERNRIK